MVKKHLLILGGGALNYKSVQEAKDNGFITYVADQNPNAPCFNIADVAIVADISLGADVFAKIKSYKIDGVVSMAEAGVVAAAHLTEKLKTGGISIATANNCTSKAAMRNAWKDTPYSVAFKIITTYNEAVIAAAELSNYPLIMKPDKTFGGSRGVSKINSKEELKAAFDYASSSGLNEFVILEECAEGDEFSCEVVVTKGKAHLLCIGEKVKSPAPFRVDCSVQYPARLSHMQETEIEKMCQTATTKIGIENGVAHVEFAYTNNGPKLFELGARCGGGHTPMIAKYVSGVNEFIAYCSIACGLNPKISPYKIKKGAEYRFVIFEPGTVQEVVIPPSFIDDERVFDLVVTIKSGDKIMPLINTSARAGALVVFEETLQKAIELSDTICKQLKVHYVNGEEKSAILF